MIVALGLACMMSSPVNCTPVTPAAVHLTEEECVQEKPNMEDYVNSQGFFLADFKCVDFTKQED